MRIPPNLIKTGTFIGVAGGVTAGGIAAARVIVAPPVASSTQQAARSERPEDVVAQWFDADATNSTAQSVGTIALLGAGALLGSAATGTAVPRVAQIAAGGVAVAAAGAMGYTGGRDDGLLRQVEANQQTLLPGFLAAIDD